MSKSKAEKEAEKKLAAAEKEAKEAGKRAEAAEKEAAKAIAAAEKAAAIAEKKSGSSDPSMKKLNKAIKEQYTLKGRPIDPVTEEIIEVLKTLIK